MTRTVLVIGIGAGNPEHLTVQAIGALNRADVLFVPVKGAAKDALAQLRRDICDRFVDGAYRLVEYDMPTRRAAGGDYSGAVADWHAAIADIHTRLIENEIPEGGSGAFLVWGDPALYDSTLRILERVRDRVAFAVEVIPGISAVQALAAAHGVPLNAIGAPVHITTGRRLSATVDVGEDGGDVGRTVGDVGDVGQTVVPVDDTATVVMLDDGSALATADGRREIFWGAYLGTPDEILVHGRLADVRDEILRLRAEARARHGWIMDTYLLRRPGG